MPASPAPLAAKDAAAVKAVQAVPVALPLTEREQPPCKAPRRGGRELDIDELVLASQRLVLGSYFRLVHTRVFPCGVDTGLDAFQSGASLCSGIQDPTAALTIALLIVRRNRDKLLLLNARDMTLSNRLGVHTRRVLAAIFCVAHKMTAHTGDLPHRVYAQFVVGATQSPLDVPRRDSDWNVELDKMFEAEMAVLSEPLLALATCNPVAQLERLLEALQCDRALSADDAAVCRGAAFFFVGSLLFQKHVLQVDKMIDRLGMPALAGGCAIVVFACMAALCEKARTLGVTEEEAYAKHASLIAEECVAARHGARLLLAAARSVDAGLLRQGPYRVNGEFGGGELYTHPIQMLLHPSNLERAYSVARAKGWVTEEESESVAGAVTEVQN